MKGPVGIIASAKFNAATGPPLTGLLWWLDADDATTITQAAGLVSQWRDKSGGGNHGNSGAGFQPTLTAGALKAGRNALVFASGKRFDITNGSTNQKPFSAVAVIKHTNTASYRAIMGTPNSGGLEWRISNTHKQSVVKNQVVELGVTTPVVTANVTVVLIITYSAVGVLDVYMDGTSQLSTTNNQAFSAVVPLVYIGDSVGEPFIGTMGELLKYDHVLSSTELSQINSYLNAKWK